jgi:hypothetical protein
MKQIEHFLKCSDLSQETWFAYLYEVTRSIVLACIYAKTYFSSHSRGLSESHDGRYLFTIVMGMCWK